jgi:hypothetical protein
LLCRLRLQWLPQRRRNQVFRDLCWHSQQCWPLRCLWGPMS